MDEDFVLLECIKGICKNDAILFPTDIVEILLISTDKEGNMDIDIKVIESKVCKGLETVISGEDLVNHFKYK